MNHNYSITTRAALVVALLGAGCGTTEDKHDPIDPGADLSGTWRGSAASRGQVHLKSGTFPATLHLVQSGDRVRGILDVNQRAAEFADWFGYYLEGTVKGDTITVELTDRTCGAGEPAALCAPRWGASKEKVFVATWRRTGGSLEGISLAVKDGVTYPDDVAIELPYESLRVELADAGASVQVDPLAGEWSGPFNPPFSVIFGGFRFFGSNTFEFAVGDDGRHRIERFDNNGVNVYPSVADDLLLVNSFAFDPATRRFWVLEAGSVWARWLWIGEVRDDRVVGHFVSDPLDDPKWQAGATPIDPFDVPFERFEATFQFLRNK